VVRVTTAPITATAIAAMADQAAALIPDLDVGVSLMPHVAMNSKAPQPPR
jgi:hypothetical protein